MKPKTTGVTGQSSSGAEPFRLHIHRYRLPLLDAQRSLVQLTPIPEV
jgi:hypothetical protein